MWPVLLVSAVGGLSGAVALAEDTAMTMGPTVAVLINRPSLRPNETLTISVTVTNPGPARSVDAYLGVQFPDGRTRLYLSPAGLTQEARPLARAYGLASGASLGPVGVLTAVLAPSVAPGTYTWIFTLTDPDSPSAVVASASTAISVHTEPPTGVPSTTLKELAAARGIRIGGNYDYELRSITHDRIFEREFNAMTVGFFGDVIYPGGRSDPVFSETDERVSWATTRSMEVLGQTLVWFEDIPAWVKSTPVSQVEAAMFKHIDALVSRSAGQVKLWNVVNEAIDDEGNMRLDHRWAEAMGADYISKAFIRAHAADPTAILYYNEYDIESNIIKYKTVKALLKDLLRKGVPVHALGWQMHVKPGSFDPTTLLARFNEIADMGLDNYITELDVELPSEATTADYENQRQTYKTIVETFLAARRRKTVVVWGLRDGSPYWLTNGHPLLFDESFRKKPAYFGVQEALVGP